MNAVWWVKSLKKHLSKVTVRRWNIAKKHPDVFLQKILRKQCIVYMIRFKCRDSIPQLRLKISIEICNRFPISIGLQITHRLIFRLKLLSPLCYLLTHRLLLIYRKLRAHSFIH